MMKLAARRLPVKVKYIYNQRWLCKPALVMRTGSLRAASKARIQPALARPALVA